MLKLNHRSSLFGHVSHRVRFKSVAHEDDELIVAIEQAHDGDTFTLEKTPDIVGLDEFWTGVERDLKNDPGWFSFSDT